MLTKLLHVCTSERVRWCISIGFLLLILAHAFKLRERFLLKGVLHAFKNQPNYIKTFLTSDAKYYYKYAIELPYPCFTIARPPGFLVITKFVIGLFGYPDAITKDRLDLLKDKISNKEYKEQKSKILYNHIILRYAAIFYLLSAMIVFFVIGTYIFGRFISIFSLMLWSITEYSIFFPYIYFRGDFVTFLNFLFLLILIFMLKKREIGLLSLSIYSILAIFIGGVLVLTRSSSFSTILLALIAFNILQLLYRQWSWKILLSSAVIYIGIFLSSMNYFVYNYNISGRFMPYMDHHAKYWRNQEFAGKEGFPNKEEVFLNLYCGDNISLYDYIFKLHSPKEILVRYIKGYWTAFTKYIPKLYKFWIYDRYVNGAYLAALIPLGLLILILNYKNNRDKLFVIIFGFIVLSPFAFILPLNTVVPPWFTVADKKNIGVDLRFSLPILPYSLLLVSIAIEWTINGLYRLFMHNFIKEKLR